MAVWSVDRPGPIEHGPLVRGRRSVPLPGKAEIRIRVAACGVCRTDLHIAAGELAVHRPGVVPGHEIVGYVDSLGEDAVRFVAGERVGIAWLRSTCGTCRFCSTGRENLCLTPRFTGWDDDGGYAEYAVVPEAYAYRLPEQFDDVAAAPLLCAGIIGYRALERALVPDGGRLGIYGFGGSAHLAAQLAIHRGATVHVLTRSASARALALELGCASAGHATDAPPEPLDAAILFAPAGELVPGRAPGPRSRRHAGDRRDPPVGHSSDRLQERAVPGTPGPQCHRQHPARRRALPARGSRGRRPRPHRRVPVRGRRSGLARPLERRRRRCRCSGAPNPARRWRPVRCGRRDCCRSR